MISYDSETDAVLAIDKYAREIRKYNLKIDPEWDKKEREYLRNRNDEVDFFLNQKRNEILSREEAKVSRSDHTQHEPAYFSEDPEFVSLKPKENHHTTTAEKKRDNFTDIDVNVTEPEKAIPRENDVETYDED